MEITPQLLKVAGCENTRRQADVIFVHGLDGDARTTWHPLEQPAHFWPAWLGEDCPQLGVWSLGYAVSASAWKGHSMPLYDRADNTLDLLDLDGIGQRPLAFVCHSLGGLLIKQALRNALDALNPHWQALARQTRLIEDTVLHPESGNTPGRDTDTSKLTVCRRLGADWHDLADYFQIPSHERTRFERGREPQCVWERLEARARLPELGEALTAIGRTDLLEFVPPRP